MSSDENCVSRKVFPLGDSITGEYFSDLSCTYPFHLHKKLKEKGWEGEFHGHLGKSPVSFEAHPGATTGKVLEVLQSPNRIQSKESGPDDVLIHLGTNDVGSLCDSSDGEQELEKSFCALSDIIQLLRDKNAAVDIYLGELLNMHGDDLIIQQRNELAEHWNNKLVSFAKKYESGVSKIIVVPMCEVLGVDDFVNDGWENGLHPNAEGAEKMAQCWADKLLSCWNDS